MSNWEYKVITSGRGGFATPALLEKFLNDLGQDEWEIIEFRSSAENALAFSGLARRATQRDWTLEDAAAAAARAEADKLRAEFEAKFKGMSGGAGSPAANAGDEAAAMPVIGGPDDGLRRLRDTDSDQDPDAPAEPEDEWDKLSSEDELPTFFDAIRPLMRRNQRGPGLSVGVDQLARKWDFSEDDVKAALTECGMAIPEDEDTKPVYIEYDGDLYWVNVNRRGELWVNTREKPRQVFRTVRGNAVAGQEQDRPAEEGKSSEASDRSGGESQQSSNGHKQQQQGQPLPAGPDLLRKIRPQMRRNRRGPGASGSTGFLSRALRSTEDDLMSGFAALGLVPPAAENDKPVFVEIGEDVWWLNKDQRGGVWINQRLKSDMREPEAESAAAGPDGAAASENAPASAPGPTDSTLAACRLLLKETKTGGFAATVDALAAELTRPVEQLTAALVEAGLRIPEKAREKPVFVEGGEEIFWLNKNAGGELWLNAKASKFSAENRRGPRSRKPKKDAGEPADGAPAAAPAADDLPAQPQN